MCVLLAFELTSPFVFLSLIFALFRSHGTHLVSFLGALLLSLLSFLSDAFGLHEVVLAALRFAHHLVADAVLGWVSVWDFMVNSIMVISVSDRFMMLFLSRDVMTVLRNQIGADIVKIIHLFALVAL